MFSEDLTSQCVQPSATGVVSRSCPDLQNVIDLRSRHGRQVQEPFHHPSMMFDSATDLRLLEHDLGDEDGPWISILPPR